jgi:hypothetical protein
VLGLEDVDIFITYRKLMEIVLSKYPLLMRKNYIPCIHSTYCIMVGYYDYVLGLIPLTLLGLTGALVLSGMGLTIAVPLGAGVSGLLVGHALFVNGPVAPDEVTPTPTTTPTAAPADVEPEAASPLAD